MISFLKSYAEKVEQFYVKEKISPQAFKRFLQRPLVYPYLDFILNRLLKI